MINIPLKNEETEMKMKMAIENNECKVENNFSSQITPREKIQNAKIIEKQSDAKDKKEKEEKKKRCVKCDCCSIF